MDDVDAAEVEALAVLCGGRHNAARRKEVAAAIHGNEQTLYQILSGAKLESGKPRGVGRNIRGRLDKAFPGWRDAKPAAPLPRPTNLFTLPAAPDCIKLLADKLAALDEGARAITIGALMGWLGQGAPAASAEHLRRLLGEFSPPQAETKLSRNGAA